ncbi:MAG: hypothetical protein OER96_09630 [Gammaproteobacteria bacterium]|nr:hypothetical protein [Gammaproteobacteria bacterium]
MKRPTFFRSVLLGLGISITGAILFTLLSGLISNDLVIRWIIAGAGMVYIVNLIRISGQRVGGITTVVIWLCTSAIILWWHPPSFLYLAAHTTLIWLVRSFYFYSSILSALTDLGLSFLSLCAAVWAATHTGNVFLSMWCFFLMQALCSFIPLHFKQNRNTTSAIQDDRFQQAYRTAEAAVSKLSSIH